MSKINLDALEGAKLPREESRAPRTRQEAKLEEARHLANELEAHAEKRAAKLGDLPAPREPQVAEVPVRPVRAVKVREAFSVSHEGGVVRLSPGRVLRDDTHGPRLVSAVIGAGGIKVEVLEV